MHTTSAEDVSSDGSTLSTVDPAWTLIVIPEPQPTDTDDAWPLEVWLSREEPDPDSDTWHVRTVRGMRPYFGRGLRSFLAGRRR